MAKEDIPNSPRITRQSGQDPLVQLMLRALAIANEDRVTASPRPENRRMDPLLRQLMITALERSQDERDRDNLTPPNYRQDPLLRQLQLSLTSQDALDRDNLTPPEYRQDPLLRKLMNNIVDSFAEMVLELPRRNQDHLLQILRAEGSVDREIENLFPPSSSQNPLLRQLMNGINEDFLESLNPPSSRQNPLLRQLSQNAQDDQNAPLVPPEYKQNPLLRQLSSNPSKDDSFLDVPIFRQDVPKGQASTVNGQGKLDFQTLMNALSSAAGMVSPESTLPSVSASTRVQGGIDFSTATTSADGSLCVTREDTIETVVNDPVLECSHEEEEKCHLTYITYYKPTQNEICEENFEKSCHITFRKEASKETITKCNRPLEKFCNGVGTQDCRMEFETSCSTRRVELSPGKYIGDTKCTKIPVEICGAGCETQEGTEECHEEGLDSLVDVPEEYCDIIPQKSCRKVTKLVPNLRPTQECTVVPKEICNMNFSQKKIIQKPLRTEWCLDRNMATNEKSLA